MKYTSAEFKAEITAVKNKWFDEWNKEGEKPSWDYQEKQNEIYTEWLLSLEVGDHAHIAHYSDVTPCTVIKRTATTITVRNDTARKSDKWNPQWIAGGFAAHCINNENQDDWWICEEDPNGTEEIFRWRKKSQNWMNTCDERLYPEWKYHYDYNF